jgi:hypothetical protein
MGSKWTDQPSKARVLRVATDEDLSMLAPGVAGRDGRMTKPRSLPGRRDPARQLKL